MSPSAANTPLPRSGKKVLAVSAPSTYVSADEGVSRELFQNGTFLELVELGGENGLGRILQSYLPINS
jgi:hypothetical protein